MIDYTYKRGLLEEVSKQGYLLYQLDNVWISNNDIEVQNIIDNFVEIPEVNWDLFNGYMLSDPLYQQAVGNVLTIAPGLATAIPAALSLVSTNGGGAFNLVWSNFCTIANISTEQRLVWCDFALSCNLPQDFIDVLGG